MKRQKHIFKMNTTNDTIKRTEHFVRIEGFEVKNRQQSATQTESNSPPKADAPTVSNLAGCRQAIANFTK